MVLSKTTLYKALVTGGDACNIFKFVGLKLVYKAVNTNDVDKNY